MVNGENQAKVSQAVKVRREATKQSPIIRCLPRRGWLPPDQVRGRNDGFFDFLRACQYRALTFASGPIYILY